MCCVRAETGNGHEHGVPDTQKQDQKARSMGRYEVMLMDGREM